MWRCALAGEGNWQVSFFKKEKQKKRTLAFARGR